MSKQKIKVGFTRDQHAKVHAFLEWIKGTGQVERDLGSPVKVEVDWSDNLAGFPAVVFTGATTGLTKVLPLQGILEADDSNLKGPVLKLVKDSHGN